MNSTHVRAVDVHAHYGHYQREEASELLESFSTGDADEVVRRAEQANVRITVVSPLSGLLPRGKSDVVKGNREARETVRNRPSLRQWVILHPAVTETYEQAVDILKEPYCVGIKLHPEEHTHVTSRNQTAEWPFLRRLDIHVKGLGVVFEGKFENFGLAHGLSLGLED